MGAVKAQAKIVRIEGETGREGGRQGGREVGGREGDTWWARGERRGVVCVMCMTLRAAGRCVGPTLAGVCLIQL